MKRRLRLLMAYLWAIPLGIALMILARLVGVDAP